MANQMADQSTETLPPLQAVSASGHAPIYQPGMKPMDYINELIQNRPDYQQQYNAAAENLNKAYSARSVEGEDAAQWAALAKGFAQPAGNFWQSLANAGANKGEVVAGIDASHIKAQQELAKQEYSHISELLKTDTAFNKGMLTPMMKQQFANQKPIKLSDGTWGTYDPVSGTVKPLAESQAAGLQKDYDTYYKLGSKILSTADPKALDTFAMQQIAKKAELQNVNPPQGVQTPWGNLTPMQNINPVVPGFTGAPSMSPDTTQITPDQQATTDAQDRLPRLQAEFAQAKAARDKLPIDDPAREQLNQVLTALVAELKAMPQPTAATVKTSPLAGVALRTPESTAEQTGRGTERGKLMEKEFHDLQGQGMAAQNLLGNLSVLENLYSKHGENIPSGAAADIVADVKSTLSTFGIKFEGIAPTDAVNAIATKGALQSRTSEGTNLLPGAMSNYEDRLLQKTFPTLSQTQEGRMLQIQIMKAQLGMKAELAQAARDYYYQNNKLDPGWYRSAQSIAAKNPFLDPKRIDAIEAYANRLTGAK